MANPSEIEKLERRWTENPAGLMFAPLAEAYRKAGSTDRALEILETGLAVHPDYVPALIVRGRCQLDGGSLMEAEQTFQQVLARDPANAIALRCMADLCERSGRLPEAIERLELLSEVDGSNSEARAALVRLKEAVALGGVSPTAPAAASEAAERLHVEPDPLEADRIQVEKSAEALSSGPEELDDSTRASLSWNPVPLLSWNEPEEVLPTPSSPSEPAGEPVLDERLSSELMPEAVSAESWSEPVAEEVAPEAAPEPAPAPVAESEPAPWLVEPGAADEGDVPSWTPAPEPVAEAVPLEEPAGVAAMFEPGVSIEPGPVPEQEPAARIEAAAESEAVAESLAPPPVPAWEQELDLVDEPVMEAVGMPALEAPAPEAPAPEAPAPEALLLEAGDQPEPAEATWEVAEVAPEPAVGESPVMTEPVPPESPEAAELPWPAVDQSEPVADPVAEEPALVVTESMAELFLKQGHRELALAVYRQLRDRSPESESLAEAVTRLEGEVASRLAASEPAPRPSRAASVTGGTSVEAMLRAVLASPPPTGTSSVLPPAIEPAAGAPARESEPLTLGQVFGDEPVVPPPAVESEPTAAAEPSFDQFFGASPPAAESTAAAGSRPAEGEDMRQFSEWLKGLKR